MKTQVTEIRDWDYHFRGLPSAMRGLFPILYTACAESDATPAEQRHQAENSLNGLPQEAQAFVRSLLTPERPLLARDFVHMRKELRELIAQQPQLNPESPLLEVATALSGGSRELLATFQEKLGLEGEETPIELFPEPQPHSASPPRSSSSLERGLRDWLGRAGASHPGADERVAFILKQLEHPRFRHEYGISTPAFRERVHAWCQELAAQGLGSMAYPKDLGGEGDLIGFLYCAETLATFDLSLVIKFGVNFGLFAGSIFHLGSRYHHEKFLAPAMRFELPGCFAMTETGHGSNVRALATVARYDRETREFVIHTPNAAARKDYIGNAALHARLATVFAQLEIDGEHYGVHAFMVPIRDEHHHPMAGVHIEDCGEKIGLNGVDNGRLRFNQVRVPRENMLDRFAQVSVDGEYSSPIANPTKRFFTMISTLVMGRATLAGASLSVSKVALATALHYSDERRQFGEEGRPETSILDYQTHQRRLIPRLAATVALQVTVRKIYQMCEASLSDEEVRRQLESLASGLKAWSTWHALDTVQIARECCGGQGYLAINRFGHLKADLDVFTTFEGDNTVLMQQVTKALLTDYKHQFADMRLLGLMKHFTSQAAASVLEWNPVTARNTDGKHLRDSEFHLRALKVRESHLLSSLARRLKKKIDDGQKPWDAALSCQDHMVMLGRAHIERVLAENFVQAVSDFRGDDATQEAAKRMCDLFALSILERERGWYLENGYFEGAKTKAIRDLVLSLCRRCKEDSLAWVAAFNLPPKSLSAPIARSDYPIPPVGEGR